MGNFPVVAVVALAMLVSQAFAAWDGSSKVPIRVSRNDSLFYEITSPEELIGYLATLTSSPGEAHAYLKNDIVFGSDTASLSPVFRAQKSNVPYLNSVFDGQDHTIYGYYSSKGVFETIGSEGVVKNLNLANSEIGADTVYTIGGLANANLGQIENVEVRNTQVFSSYHTGGIVGCVNSQSKLASVRNARMVGGSVKGKVEVGGIVGWVNGSLENVYNSSTVTVEQLNNENGPTVSVGGIAGYCEPSDYSAFSSLVNEGNVSAYTNRIQVNVGGIAGIVEAEVRDALNKGKVFSKTKGANSYTGGLFGLAAMPSRSGNLSNLSNQGPVSAITWEKDTSSVVFYVGGAVGFAQNANLANVFNSAAVEVSARGAKSMAEVGGIVGYYKMSYDDRKMSGVGNWGSVSVEAGRLLEVGGIAGYMKGYSSKSAPILSFSFNHGNVTAKSTLDTTRMYIFHVGGAVGYSERGTIHDIYNLGNVIAENYETLEDTRFEGEINFVGGLVGCLYGTDGSALMNSYSAAKKIQGDRIGGIVGTLYYGSPTKKNSFDSTLLKIDAAGDTAFMYYYNPGHDLLKTGKSTAYMTSDEFLVSLNTAQDSLSDRGIWNRDDDRNAGYPYFSFDTTDAYEGAIDYAGWDGTSKTPKQMLIDDTLYFAITSPEELVGYLDLLIQKNGLARGALMNDISFGKDTATLSKRKLERGAADPFNCLDEKFIGQGHTIYGLNTDRGLFHCTYKDGIILDLTIAGSAFHNENGQNIASVVDEAHRGVVKGVSLRNSSVKTQGFAAGGLVGGGLYGSNRDENYGYVLNSNNENSRVQAGKVAGGVAVFSETILSELTNSGEVISDSIAGGIVAVLGAPGASALLSKSSNRGNVSAEGYGDTYAAGIAALSWNLGVRSSESNGKIRSVSKDAVAFAGGISAYQKNDMDYAQMVVSSTGNRGTVYAEGQAAIAGGIVGQSISLKSSFNVITESFNYGTIEAKADSFAYVAGIVGNMRNTLLQRVYNRGAVIHDGYAGKEISYGAGLAAYADSLSILAYSYSVSDSIAAGVAHEIYAEERTDGGAREITKTSVFSLENTQLEEMQSPEFAETLGEPFVYNPGCFPIFANDTSSTCYVAKGDSVETPADKESIRIVRRRESLPRANWTVRREGNLLRVYGDRFKGGDALFDLTGHRVR